MVPVKLCYRANYWTNSQSNLPCLLLITQNINFKKVFSAKKDIFQVEAKKDSQPLSFGYTFLQIAVIVSRSQFSYGKSSSIL